MHQRMEEKLWQLILEYCRDRNLPVIWKKPIVRFADVRNPGFMQMKKIVVPEHYMPEDFLPEAKNVLSWFLPFLPDVGRDNLEGSLCSSRWANAYLVTNEMAVCINEQLAAYIREELGFDAAAPVDAGMISMENPRSRWSQRHVAYLAGHGTFGRNNMLISDAGTVGRYFSIVTTLDTETDTPVTEERCLWKKDGSCGACVMRCEAGALTASGFDRFRCLQQCLTNMERYPGADVCGKCIVELPCSYKIPETEEEY